MYVLKIRPQAISGEGVFNLSMPLEIALGATYGGYFLNGRVKGVGNLKGPF